MERLQFALNIKISARYFFPRLIFVIIFFATKLLLFCYNKTAHSGQYLLSYCFKEYSLLCIQSFGLVFWEIPFLAVAALLFGHQPELLHTVPSLASQGSLFRSLEEAPGRLRVLLAAN